MSLAKEGGGGRRRPRTVSYIYMTKGLIECFSILFEKVNCVFCPIVYETKTRYLIILVHFAVGLPPFTVLDSYRTNIEDPGLGLQLKYRTGHG